MLSIFHQHHNKMSIDTKANHSLICGGIILVVVLAIIGISAGIFRMRANDLSDQLPGHTYRVSQNVSGRQMPSAYEPRFKFVSRHCLIVKAGRQTVKAHVQVKPKQIIIGRELKDPMTHKEVRQESALALVKSSGKRITVRPDFTMANGRKITISKAKSKPLEAQLIRIK